MRINHAWPYRVALIVLPALTLSHAPQALAVDDAGSTSQPEDWTLALTTEEKPQFQVTKLDVLRSARVLLKGGDGRGAQIKLHVPAAPPAAEQIGSLSVALDLVNRYKEPIELRIALKRNPNDRPETHTVRINSVSPCKDHLSWSNIKADSDATIYLALSTKVTAAHVDGEIHATMSYFSLPQHR